MKPGRSKLAAQLIGLCSFGCAALIWACAPEPLPTGSDGIEEQAQELVVEPPRVVLGVGARLQLRATPLMANGRRAAGYDIYWSSSQSEVATVQADGTIIAVATGSAKITAQAEKKNKGKGRAGAPGRLKKVVDVTVEANPVIQVTVWPQDLTLQNGQLAQLYAALLREDGTTDCQPRAPSNDPAVLFNGNVVAGCDSAIALLNSATAGTSGTRIAPSLRPGRNRPRQGSVSEVAGR